MRANGWQGDPVDLVKMPDGKLTSMDNTRIAAAREAGIDVRGNVRGFDEPLTPAIQEARNWQQYNTWGEAITGCIKKQTGGFSSNNPYGSPEIPRISGVKKHSILIRYAYSSQGFQISRTIYRCSNRRCSEDLWPWKLMSGDMPLSLSYFGSLLLKFPDRYLVPFAIINDESGLYHDGWVVLACFDGLDFSGDPAVRIYDYSRPKISPWEDVGYQSFGQWLEAARREALDYRSTDERQ